MKKHLLIRKIITLTSAIGILFTLNLNGSFFVKANALVALDPNNSSKYESDPHNTTASASYQIQSGDYYYEIMPDDSIKIDSYSGSDTELILPNTIDNKIVSTLGTMMFYYSNNRDSVTKVVVPEGITDIDGAAFFGCSSLTEVSLPSTLQTIRYGAFYECSNLSKITIPSSVTTIDSGAFKGTKWLSDQINENPMVIINDILIDGSQCFGDVVIPDNVRKISACAFPYSDNISSITIPKEVDDLGSIGYKGDLYLSETGGRAASIRERLENFIVYCYSDTPAEEYVIKNELEYQIIDEQKAIPIDTNITENRENLINSSESDESTLIDSSSESKEALSEDVFSSTATNQSTYDYKNSSQDNVNKGANNTIYIVLIISILFLAAVIVICTIVNVKNKK